MLFCVAEDYNVLAPKITWIRRKDHYHIRFGLNPKEKAHPMEILLLCHVNKHTVKVGLHDSDSDSVSNSESESPSAALMVVRVAVVTRHVASS